MLKSTLLILGLCLSQLLNAQLSTSSQVIESANSGVQSFLAMIPQGHEQEYGFANRSIFSKVEIGEPYQTYFVVKENEAVFFKETQLWRVPLVVDNQFLALLTVIVKDGVATVVDLGAARLAKELQYFETTHKGEKNERILVRNTYISKDFIAPNFSQISSPSNNELRALNLQSQTLLFPISKEITTAGIAPKSFAQQTITATVK